MSKDKSNKDRVFKELRREKIDTLLRQGKDVDVAEKAVDAELADYWKEPEPTPTVPVPDGISRYRDAGGAAPEFFTDGMQDTLVGTTAGHKEVNRDALLCELSAFGAANHFAFASQRDIEIRAGVRAYIKLVEALSKTAIEIHLMNRHDKTGGDPEKFLVVRRGTFR